MSMNGSCRERHVLVSKSFCKMKRLLMVSYPASALLPRSAETEKNPMTWYINTYIIFNCKFIYKRLLWVALTRKSLHRLHLPKKAASNDECPKKCLPNQTVTPLNLRPSQPFDLLERPPCVLPLPSFLSPMRLLGPNDCILGGVFFPVFPRGTW